MVRATRKGPAGGPPSSTADQRLLDQARQLDTNSDFWRVLRIQAEFVEGFGTLAGLGPAVSVFGSARTPEGSAEYALAHEVGTRLARAGYTVITGGGPGTMAAANPADSRPRRPSRSPNTTRQTTAAVAPPAAPPSSSFRARWTWTLGPSVGPALGATG